VLSLVLPTYNEAKSLPILLPAISQTLGSEPHEIIIVDDNSPDRTWEVATQYPGVRVLRRVGRRGLSSAVVEGFSMAKGDVLVVMDADGQHDTGVIAKLAAAVRGTHGVAIGTRYMKGGGVGEWEKGRASLSWLATKLAQIACRVRAHDPMSGFFALDAALFRRIATRLHPSGFKILLEILAFVPKGTPITEIPFTFGRRIAGESKLTWKVGIQFLLQLGTLMMRRHRRVR
jgi:dolichol-phosphate mannosyltransferase